MLDNNEYGLKLSELLSGNHLLGIKEIFLTLGKEHLERPESSWNMIAGPPRELETQISLYKKGGNDLDAAFASLRRHDVESLLPEFSQLREIVWIAKHRSEIDDWFRTESGVFAAELSHSRNEEDEGLIWYESFITNYVIRHAEKFRGDKPEQIWFELNLGDTRIDKKVTGRDKADLLLQFPDEVWIVEVKYSPNSPDPETALVKRCKRQLEKYRRQLEHLIDTGWFPGRKVRLPVFWAFWNWRKKVLRLIADTLDGPSSGNHKVRASRTRSWCGGVACPSKTSLYQKQPPNVAMLGRRRGSGH